MSLLSPQTPAGRSRLPTIGSRRIVWPEGPVCPHCGSVERISKMAGKATRFGLYKCYACRKQFP